MRNTPDWQEWTALLSAHRLRDLIDAINTQEQVTGTLAKPDIFLRKILNAELERRYANAEGN